MSPALSESSDYVHLGVLILKAKAIIYQRQYQIIYVTDENKTSKLDKFYSKIRASCEFPEDRMSSPPHTGYI